MKLELPLTLTYRCEKSHWFEYLAAAQRRAFKLMHWALSFGLGLWLLGAFEFLTRCQACDVDQGSFGTGYLVVLVPWLLWGLVARRLLADRMLTSDGTILGQRSLTVTPEAIETRGAHDRARHQWPAISGSSRGKTTLVLWTELGVGLFLPRNTFSSVADEQSFSALIEERIAASNKN